MCDTGYTVRDFVADLRELAGRGESEAVVLEEVREMVKRLLLMKHNWLRSSMQQPSGDPERPTIYKLHEEPDHSITVNVVTWMPGRETRPHNHETWAVVGGLSGWETQHLWKRVDDDRVERISTERIDAKTIVTLDSQTIHSVHNDSGALSVTLHVYGRDPEYTDRRHFEAMK